jgi:hypothetical protein
MFTASVETFKEIGCLYVLFNLGFMVVLDFLKMERLFTQLIDLLQGLTHKALSTNIVNMVSRDRI